MRTKYIKLGHSIVKISFLTFENDTMVFAKAIEESCHTIKNNLDKFCSMTDQLVNFNKCALQYTQNMSGVVCAKFVSILRMEEPLSLGKYLGCQVISSKVTNATFGEIQEKVYCPLNLLNGELISSLRRVRLYLFNLI